MSSPLPDYQLKRLAWLAALEDSKNSDRQTCGVYEADGKVCAVGLLMETIREDKPWTAQAAVGLDTATVAYVQCWNDDEELTFPEIAERLRRRWK